MQDIITKDFKCTPELYEKSIVVIEKYLNDNKFIFRKIKVGYAGINFQIKVKNWFLHIYLEPNGLESDLNSVLKLTELRVNFNFNSKEITAENIQDNGVLFSEAERKLEIIKTSKLGEKIYDECLVLLKEEGFELEE